MKGKGSVGCESDAHRGPTPCVRTVCVWGTQEESGGNGPIGCVWQFSEGAVLAGDLPDQLWA